MRCTQITAISVATAALAMFSGHGAAASFDPYFLPLGDLPGGRHESFANAISRDGRVVVGRGTSLAVNGTSQSEAFRWTVAEGMIGLGALPGAAENGSINSNAAAVSADGSVIVGQSDSQIRPMGEAFRWTEQTGMQTIIHHDTALTLRSSSASAVSDEGSIIYGGGQAFSNNGLYAFRYVPGLFQQTSHPQPVAVSADGSLVAGNRYAIPGPGTSTAYTYEWLSGDPSLPLGDLPGGAIESTARDISADGSIIVGWSASALGHEPFLWTANSGMQSLGLLPAELSNWAHANAISADGRVVVGEGVNGVGGAFIWTQEDGIRLLTDVLTVDYGVGIGDWQVLLSGNDISADGRTIVGYGVNAQGRYEAYVAHIPEPGTLILLFSVTAMSLARRSRNGTKSQPIPIVRTIEYGSGQSEIGNRQFPSSAIQHSAFSGRRVIRR